MEKGRRVSIGTLCVVVAVVAVDLAWWRSITVGHHISFLGFRGRALDAGAMPMASFLAIGLAHIRSNRGRAPRRLVGFLWGGLAGLLIYLIYNWTCLLLPQDVVYKTMEPIYLAWKRWPWLDPRLNYDYLYYADIVYYGTPQMILSLIVGLSWNWKRASVNKPESSPIPPLEDMNS